MQISDTVYPMYKAYIEPDLKTAHLKIYNTFNPFSGFMDPTYILKSAKRVSKEVIHSLLKVPLLLLTPWTGRHPHTRDSLTRPSAAGERGEVGMCIWEGGEGACVCGTGGGGGVERKNPVCMAVAQVPSNIFKDAFLPVWSLKDEGLTPSPHFARSQCICLSCFTSCITRHGVCTMHHTQSGVRQ